MVLHSFFALLGSNIYSVAGPRDAYKHNKETWVTPSYYANYSWSLVSISFSVLQHGLAFIDSLVPATVDCERKTDSSALALPYVLPIH